MSILNSLPQLWQWVLNLLNDHTIMGVLIGGGISIYSSNAIFNKKSEQEAQAIVKAIFAEIKALKWIFINEFRNKIENNEEYLSYIYPLGTDYFCIYHSNTSQIGKIKNGKLRENIINIYVCAKFFMDSLKTNNCILEDLENIEDDYKNMPQEAKTMYPNYMDRKKVALYRLKLSKSENLLPTYNKLKQLFEIFEKETL